MSRPLEVALLQLRAFDLADHERAWDTMWRAVDEAALARPDLIVLPEASYPAYFLGSRDAYEDARVRPDDQIEAALSERARRHGCVIAAGLVLHAEDGTNQLEDVCLVCGPDGEVLARSAKALLWHFDGAWFRAGSRFPTFDLGGTTAGAVIGTDIHEPEAARLLRDQGARILLSPAAWIAGGQERVGPGTSMAGLVAPARSLENGTWMLVADKVGIEAQSISYAGRSGVINPRGDWVVQAPGDRPGIISYRLDPEESVGAPVERRPQLYAAAFEPARRTEAQALARQSLIAEDAAARVAALALDPDPSAVGLMERCRGVLRALAAQDVALVVLPDLAGHDPRAVTRAEFLPLFAELSEATSTLLVVGLAERDGARTYKTQYLLDRGRLIAAHRQTHLSSDERAAGFAAGDREPPVLDTQVGYVGLMAGSEGLVPEFGRSLKLRGAEVLAWSAGVAVEATRLLARARAVEDRCYVVAAGTSEPRQGACLVDPSGRIIGESLAGEQMAASADVNRVFARWNDLAPHTNLVRDRQIEAFTSLFEAATPTAV